MVFLMVFMPTSTCLHGYFMITVKNKTLGLPEEQGVFF